MMLCSCLGMKRKWVKTRWDECVRMADTRQIRENRMLGSLEYGASVHPTGSKYRGFQKGVGGDRSLRLKFS
jgi:hypothetical protein